MQNNETENSFKKKEIQTVKEPIKLQVTRYLRDSNVSEQHCQQFDECYDNFIIENIDDNIFDHASNASSNESCSSIEYLIEDDILIKKDCNSNNAKLFSR